MLLHQYILSYMPHKTLTVRSPTDPMASLATVSNMHMYHRHRKLQTKQSDVFSMKELNSTISSNHDSYCPFIFENTGMICVNDFNIWQHICKSIRTQVVQNKDCQ